MIKEEDLEDFYYHTYEKVITWKKSYYHVLAPTKEQADAYIKQEFSKDDLGTWRDNPQDLALTVKWYDSGEDYIGDDELVSFFDNNNSPTYELYDDNCDLIFDNTPIEISRDKKIDKLLQTYQEKNI